MSDSPSFPASLLLETDAFVKDGSKFTEDEQWWADQQIWLSQQGYVLRARYRPGWVPSWTKGRGREFEAEDRVRSRHPLIMDAVRSSDNNVVIMKRVNRSEHEYEVEISKYLSSEDLRKDPHNHCVSVLDVLDVPDQPDVEIIVLPLLRGCHDPRWDTVGEVVAFFDQILEGLQFMHQHHVAHRDCMLLNIMYDPRPMYPNLFHPAQPWRSRDYKGAPKHSTRTMSPVRYYLIDFGLSRKYNPEDGPPREHPIRGGDKTVPEFQNWNGALVDPFPTDIYYLGNIMKMHVLERFHGVEFMKDLVDNMTQADPSKRPVIDHAKSQFDEIVKSLSQKILRSRLIPVDEEPGMGPWLNIRHRYRTIRYWLFRKPAIPIPT